MSQFHLICKTRTNGSKCLTAISGDTKEELLTTALEHALSIHDSMETRGLKDQYKMWIKRGAPPA